MPNEKPLMFINTVASDNLQTNSQKIYDSRSSKQKDIININKMINKKIQEYIEMHQRGIEITCMIEASTNIIGIPVAIMDDYLIALVEGKEKKILINSITDIKIISF